MTKDEALNLALEALEVVTKELLAVRNELAERGARPKTNAFHQKLWDSSFKAYTDHALPAATAIKEALAQPAQEPVAWLTRDSVDGCWYATANKVGKDDKPLYTAPPQRTWVDLTDEEIDAEANSILTSDPVQWWRRLARAVLAKSKEKNT